MTQTEYKQTRAGPKKLEIRKEWEVRDLGELVSRLTNGISESQSKDDTGFPVTRIETIAQGWVNHDKVGYVDADKSEFTDYRLEEGDVLFSHINSIPHIGKTAQYQGEEELYHGMNLLLIRFDEEEIEQEYGYIYLNSKLARDFWVSNCKQAVNQASLNQGEVESLPVIIPSRAEQRRIAEILSTVDEAVQQTDEIIETSKELKKGLMQDLLTKGIGHEEFKEVQLGPMRREIPEDWDIKRLDDISRVKRGASPRPIGDDKWFGGDVGWLRISDVSSSGKYVKETEDYLSEEGQEESVRAYPGEVILSIAATVGKPCILDIDVCIHDGIVAFKDLDEEMDEDFLYYTMWWEKNRLISKGQTGTQANINSSIVGRFKIHVPPLDEQREIAERLSVVDEKIRQEEEYREKLEELKKGLMQDLLTGKVCVTPMLEGEA